MIWMRLKQIFKSRCACRYNFNIVIKNKIEENPADLSQYGLDNPQVTVTVEKKNGQIDKMIIGDLVDTRRIFCDERRR